MSASQYERDYKHQLEAEGWTVFRSAGSLAVDLIALKRLPSGKIIVMLIEVKSFKPDVFTVRKTKRMLAQWRDMLKLAKKFTVFYSLRKKGQKTFRLVKPSALRKPYHWSKMTRPAK
jgi:Holliday junction resolvase